MNEIEFLAIEHKEIPIFTKLILGKVFDYKYIKDKDINFQIFKFTIDITDELKEALILSSSKKEKLLGNNFKLYEELEKELEFIKKKEKITEELENFKWNIECYPLYPKGSMYLIRIVMKKELKIDFELISEKNKFNYYLNNKLPLKNTKNNKRNKI